MMDDKNKKIDKQTGDKKLIQEFSANKSDTSKLISKLETCTSLIQVFYNRDVKIETKGKLKAETMDKFDYAKLGEMINTSIDNAINNKIVPMIDKSIDNAINNKVVPMIEKINNRIDGIEYNMNQQFQQVNKRIDEIEYNMNKKFEQLETDIKKIKECPTIKKELLE